MSRYFKIGCLLAVYFPLALYGQISHRHLLQKYTPEEVSRALVALEDFKPFPQSTAEWQGKLPDSLVSQLIKRGEVSLKHSFNDIPATVMLEFERNGNRTDYEKLSFEKRDWLQDLVMAEAVEGKGRFTDQIVNGIWSVCEESFWGISAHVGIHAPDGYRPGLPGGSRYKDLATTRRNG